MKQLIKQVTRGFAVATLTVGLMQSASAATNADIVSKLKEINKNLANLSSYITEMVDKAWDAMSDMIYKTETPGVNKTITANVMQKNAEDETTAVRNKAVTEDIEILFTTDNVAKAVAKNAVHVPIGSNYSDSKAQGFNGESIFGTTHFAKSDDADNFVKFITGMQTPIQSIDVKDIKDASTQKQGYVATLGGYVASQSLGFSNFKMLTAERQEQKGLAKSAGIVNLFRIPQTMEASASPLQLDEFLANRRSMNTEWYNEMETAKPLSVLREIVYTLAEMRKEMFKQRMIEERLLATQTALQLQMSRSMSLPMIEGMGKQIQKNQ